MKINIEITQQELKQLVVEHIKKSLNGDFDETKLSILTKSSQNYKSEWEIALFKATYQGDI